MSRFVASVLPDSLVRFERAEDMWLHILKNIENQSRSMDKCAMTVSQATGKIKSHMACATPRLGLVQVARDIVWLHESNKCGWEEV